MVEVVKERRSIWRAKEIEKSGSLVGKVLAGGGRKKTLEIPWSWRDEL